MRLSSTILYIVLVFNWLLKSPRKNASVFPCCSASSCISDLTISVAPNPNLPTPFTISFTFQAFCVISLGIPLPNNDILAVYLFIQFIGALNGADNFEAALTVLVPNFVALNADHAGFIGKHDSMASSAASLVVANKSL